MMGDIVEGAKGNDGLKDGEDWRRLTEGDCDGWRKLVEAVNRIGTNVELLKSEVTAFRTDVETRFSGLETSISSMKDMIKR